MSAYVFRTLANSLSLPNATPRRGFKSAANTWKPGTVSLRTGLHYKSNDMTVRVSLWWWLCQKCAQLSCRIRLDRRPANPGGSNLYWSAWQQDKDGTEFYPYILWKSVCVLRGSQQQCAHVLPNYLSVMCYAFWQIAFPPPLPPGWLNFALHDTMSSSHNPAVSMSWSHSPAVSMSCSHNPAVSMSCSHNPAVSMSCSHNPAVSMSCSHNPAVTILQSQSCSLNVLQSQSCSLNVLQSQSCSHNLLLHR